MRVFIVGSLRHLSNDETKDRMRSYCRALGAAFAKAGHTLILGSDKADTADFHVVEGIESLQDPARQKVVVYRAESSNPRPYQGRTFAHIDMSVYDTFHTQQAAHSKSVVESDIVVLIGGGSKTLAAGYVAEALGKPYLAIPGFNGSAADFWPSFKAVHGQVGISDEEMLQVQHGGEAAVAVSCAEKLYRSVGAQRPLSRSELVVLVLLVALALGWFFLATSEAPGLRQSSIVLMASILVGTVFGLAGDPGITYHSAIRVVAKSLGLAVFIFVLYASALGLLTDELANSISSPPLRTLVTLSAAGLLAGWKPDKVVSDLQGLLSKMLSKAT